MPADFETRVLLRGEQTGDEISVIENTVPGRWAGPPLHTHEFDETFYVLGGELTFQLEETLTRAAGGEIVFAPRGVPHALANQSDAGASYLLFCTPAGFERYFARLAAERAGVEPPAWALEPIPEVTRVGPQIGRAEPRDRSKH
jgi:quercetin dioxygenase-like cupin family protein